jgi:co-chaperonin GroES (HSP10)
MQAYNNYILIDKINEGPSIIGGLEVTESQNKDIRYLKGKVVSVGSRVPMLKPGNIVHYDKHAGHAIERDSKLLYVIREGDVVIIE